MADGGANGLATALRALGAAGIAVGGGEAGQSDMFEADDAALPLPAARGVSGAKGGRPLGARNRSTEEWCRFLLSQYRSPLTALAELYSRPIEDLVAHLQAIADKDPIVRVDGEGLVARMAVRINPLDVLRLQRDAAVALAPYLHKQQPKAIEIDNRPRGIVVLGDVLDVDMDGGDGSGDLALPLPPIVENQGVAARDPRMSDGDQSDIASNPLIHHD